MKDLGNGIVCMTMEERDALAKSERVDESKMCEWQCPTCKNRCLNMQRQRDLEGNQLWGCLKYCDTIGAKYFDGHACKIYEEGESYFAWP